MSTQKLIVARRGFTLVEILVVILIIAILASMLLVVISKMYRRSGDLRVSADLQTIRVALDTYQQDFGDIPRGSSADTDGNVGAATLCKALLGPYGDGFLPGNTVVGSDTSDPPTHTTTKMYTFGDCVVDAGTFIYINPSSQLSPTTTNTSMWAKFNPRDGLDGAGFVARPGAVKKWGPYLAAGKIKNQGCVLIDHRGGPILYYAAWPGPIDLVTPRLVPNGNQPYVDSSLTHIPNQSLYDAGQNFEILRQNPGETDETVVNRVRIMLGDFNFSGFIDADEAPIKLPYLLWSSGVDGAFGPANWEPKASNSEATPANNRKRVAECDDITNFK